MKFLTLEHILIHISFSAVSIGITIHLLSLLVDEFVELYDSSEKGRITCFFCITGLLVTRWIYSGHLPLSNLYESLIFLSWILSIIHMVPYFKNKNYFKSNNVTKYFFYTRFCYFGSFN
ncbi:Cytochrome c biogenesis protein CcsA [Linum perenne]